MSTRIVSLFFILFTTLLASKGTAEYRVFLLRIMEKPTIQDPNNPNTEATPPGTPAASENPSTTTDGTTAANPPPKALDIVVREFPSTLDPLQYPTYYPLRPNQYVVYVDTWRCRGRTNEKPLCPNPRQQTEANPELNSSANPAENPAQETEAPTPPVPQTP